VVVDGRSHYGRPDDDEGWWAVQFALGLPTEQPEHYEELSSGAAMVELATAAEAAGFDAISVTDHPFPQDKWLRTGGHHAFDPLVALAYVASATSRIKLLTNILVVGYRNAFLAAKGVASLDALSGGRLILGVAPGYLEPEFDVLGADFEHRNAVLDESINAMRAAWTGESVSFHGEYFNVEGHTMQPTPAQKPGPPIWIGGNSTRAMRRAVELAQGWMPFPVVQKASRYTRTANLESMSDLAGRMEKARAMAEEMGRTEPLDVCFVPFGLTLYDKDAKPDFGALSDQIDELGALGVTWLSLMFPATTRKGFRQMIDEFASLHIQGRQ
jgi:probable F420-dependent oxidoreductase